MEEIWKHVFLYGANYEVSNTGRIKGRCKELNIRSDAYGYAIVTVGKKGNRRSMCMHRLVARLFVENKDDKPEVNHVDFDRMNCRADNLEWCTHKENIEYSTSHNRNASMPGEKNPNAKLKETEVREIRNMLDNDITVYAIAKKYNVGWQTVNHIKQGTTWNSI